jgi:hypothetical protein
MNPDNQLTGIFVAADGTIKDDTHGRFVCRFSFRRLGEKGAWKPQLPGQVIKSGESVNLYCHSVGLGPYSDVNSPPAEASPVCVTPNGKLLVPIPGFTKSAGVRKLIQDYDLGKLGNDDYYAAFEKMGFVSDASWPLSQFAVTPSPEESWFTSASTTTFWGRVKSRFKKYPRVDYKSLQTPEWKNRDLNWSHVREQYCKPGESKGHHQDGLAGHEPAVFTILFE